MNNAFRTQVLLYLVCNTKSVFWEQCSEIIADGKLFIVVSSSSNLKKTKKNKGFEYKIGIRVLQ